MSNTSTKHVKLADVRRLIESEQQQWAKREPNAERRLGAVDALSEVLRQLGEVTDYSNITDAIQLPDSFVAIDEFGTMRRFYRVGTDTWHKKKFNYGWQFDDSLGDRCALQAWNESHTVAAVIERGTEQ